MNGPTPHLSYNELRCKDGTAYPLRFRLDGRDKELGEAFEQLRALAGNKPLEVLSGYRTPAHNARIGGAKNSQHMEGRALDLRPPEGMSVKRLAALARQIPAIRGVGVYPTFLHIDVRTGRRVAFEGKRAAADATRNT